MYACGKGQSHLCYGSVTQLELADCKVHLISSDTESYFLIHVLALISCMKHYSSAPNRFKILNCFFHHLSSNTLQQGPLD